jgi:hypothetical protein
MVIKEIQVLLEKYFEGETTLEEDQALLDYFSGENIDSKLRHYQQQFLLLKSGREPLVFDPEFESRLAGLIKGQGEIPQREHKTPWITRLAVAATIAVLIGISGVLFLNKEWHKEEDTFSDPQLAVCFTKNESGHEAPECSIKNKCRGKIPEILKEA